MVWGWLNLLLSQIEYQLPLEVLAPGDWHGGELSAASLIGLSQLTEVAKAKSSNHLFMKRSLFALLPLALATAAPAVMAQKEIPKAPGHDQCPLGYVNTLGSTCVSPIYYEVAPTYGEACKSGWMNIGAGYCKKKTLGIF